MEYQMGPSPPALTVEFHLALGHPITLRRSWIVAVYPRLDDQPGCLLRMRDGWELTLRDDYDAVRRRWQGDYAL
jgi:hypothetical protein